MVNSLASAVKVLKMLCYEYVDDGGDCRKFSSATPVTHKQFIALSGPPRVNLTPELPSPLIKD